MISWNDLDHRPFDDGLYYVTETDGGQQARPLEERKLADVLVRHNICMCPIGRGETGDSRQYPMDRPQRPFERQLTEEHIAVEWSLELAGRLEDADGHGEVEERPFLAKIGRREVYGDPVSGKAEPGIPDGALDAFAGLLDSRVRQADDGEHGQAVGDVDFDLHGMRRQADDANTGYCRVHRWRVVPESP